MGWDLWARRGRLDHVAAIDIAGFVADLKDHAVDHGFHVHDERHFVETYSLRQAWEVDLHPEEACGGPLDLHLSLEVDPRTLLSFEDLIVTLPKPLRERNNGEKVARGRSGIFEGDHFAPQVVQPFRWTIPLGEDERLVFGHAALPAPQKQHPGAFHVVDDVGRIGTFHVKIDLLRREQRGQLGRCTGDNNSALCFRGGRRKLSCHMLDKFLEVLFDFFLIDRRDNS